MHWRERWTQWSVECNLSFRAANRTGKVCGWVRGCVRTPRCSVVQRSAAGTSGACGNESKVNNAWLHIQRHIECAESIVRYIAAAYARDSNTSSPSDYCAFIYSITVRAARRQLNIVKVHSRAIRHGFDGTASTICIAVRRRIGCRSVELGGPTDCERRGFPTDFLFIVCCSIMTF